MANSKNTKHALVMSLVSLLLCATMLVGTTFAWFTDSVTSASNIIKSGNLDVEMYWADGTKAVPADDAGWTDASTGAIFNYANWEPGYTEVRHIKIANEGSLALKYQLHIFANGDVSDLADVIDVYFVDPAVQVADRTVLTGIEPVGTLTEVLAAMPGNVSGDLLAKETDAVTLALKMRESAGNEYQNKEIGSDFVIQLLATQDTVESDSFDDQYDADAEYDKVQLPAKNVTVTSQEEFNAAFAEAAKGDREVNIDATGVTLEITEVMANGSAAATEIPAGVTIKGATFSPTHRGGNYILMSAGANEQVVFENCIFDNAGNNLVIGSTVDGPDSVIYNNCTFTGSVITNFVDNPDGVAEFNVCRFTKATAGLPMRNFVEGMGGTHNFNGCTFDYTGVTQSSMGVISSGCVNVYSESGYSTTVVLNGCTRISCGTRTYGPNSSLVIK